MAWEPVKTNIGAGVWWAGIVSIVTGIVYPPIRNRVENFVKRHVEAGNRDLHDKLNHIIKHHPDIPDFDKDKE